MDNADQFLQMIIERFYAHLERHETDNFDKRKFSDADKPGFLAKYRPEFSLYFFQHYKGFFDSYQLLENQSSRDLYINLILYKMLGWDHVRIGKMRFSDVENMMKLADRHDAGPSKFGLGFRHMPMIHYKDFDFQGKKLCLDTLRHGIMPCFLIRQHDYLNQDINITVEENDIVIDAGAFLGDSAIKFALQAGKNGRVYAFDPLPMHIYITQHNIEQNGMGDMASIHPYGLAEKSNGFPPLQKMEEKLEPNFQIDTTKQELPLYSIDDFMTENHINKLDYIKMDIEGAEFSALKGAKNSIQKYRPKLAISLYHKFSDFIDIPQYLHETFPFYRFYLDHHTIYAGETVLYAIDESRL